MDILKQLFRDEEIEFLKKRVPELESVTRENIRDVIKVLANQKCNNLLLRKVIMTVPEVLLRDPEEMEELIYKCKEYNILHIEKILDNYPPFIMKNAYEIDGYFINMQKQNMSLEEAAKHLETYPFI